MNALFCDAPPSSLGDPCIVSKVFLSDDACVVHKTGFVSLHFCVAMQLSSGGSFRFWSKVFFFFFFLVTSMSCESQMLQVFVFFGQLALSRLWLDFWWQIKGLSVVEDLEVQELCA